MDELPNVFFCFTLRPTVAERDGGGGVYDPPPPVGGDKSGVPVGAGKHSY